MAGFVLGTGSGILASAAVYYTLSTSLHRETMDVQNQLHHSSRLLDNSFDPSTPPTPSSFVGPARNAPVPFTTLLAQRWNHAIASATSTVRQTDFLAISASTLALSRDLVGKLGKEVKESTSEIQKGHVGRDQGGLEGGVAMDRLPGRISPDVADTSKRGVQEAKEFGEGVKEEVERLRATLRGDVESKKVTDGMAGTRRLV